MGKIMIAHATWRPGPAFRESDLPEEAIARHPARSIDIVLFDMMTGLRPGSPISTGAVMKEIRRRLPQLDIDDERLANMIGDHAVGMGLSVTFDSRETDHPGFSGEHSGPGTGTDRSRPRSKGEETDNGEVG